VEQEQPANVETKEEGKTESTPDNQNQKDAKPTSNQILMVDTANLVHSEYEQTQEIKVKN